MNPWSNRDVIHTTSRTMQQRLLLPCNGFTFMFTDRWLRTRRGHVQTAGAPGAVQGRRPGNVVVCNPMQSSDKQSPVLRGEPVTVTRRWTCSCRLAGERSSLDLLSSISAR
jgi:hypothetical protein